MNIIKYLEKFSETNKYVKATVLARWINEHYLDFPFSLATTERMIQKIRKEGADSFKSKYDVSEEDMPIVNIRKEDKENSVEFDINELEQIEIEEEQMKLEKVDTTYTYKEGIYIFNDTLKLSGELISKLFIDYPRKGLNLSRTALINKYNLGQYGVDGPTVLRTIQHKLGLYKDSNIIAPHLYDELNGDELDAYIDKQLDQVIRNPEYIEKKYNNRVLTQYRNTINKQLLREVDFYNKIEEISKQFKHIPKHIITTHKVVDEEKTCVVTIADAHVGADVKGVQRTHDFDTKVIEKRLEKIAEVVNQGDYSHVYIAIMGDMFQGTPYNHIGAGNTIAEQYAEQFKTAFELLSKFIISVHNIAGIYAVGGNHDRASSDNRQDQKSSILDILVFMLSKVLNMPIEFHHDTISFIADGVHYILQHGHFNYHKKNAADIILDHGSIDKFNLIIRGHLHSLQVLSNDDRRNYRRIVVPSIYTGEDYSSTGGWSNNAGFVIFETQNYGKNSKLAPKMIVEALQ